MLTPTDDGLTKFARYNRVVFCSKMDIWDWIPILLVTTECSLKPC